MLKEDLPLQKIYIGSKNITKYEPVLQMKTMINYTFFLKEHKNSMKPSDILSFFSLKA